MLVRGRMAEFRRGWPILLAGLVGVMFGISALPFYTLGVFVPLLEREFGWSRAAIQAGFTVQMLGMLAVAWAWGMATDRWGPRRVALWSQAGLALGLAVVATTGSLPHWYAAWFLVALLGAGTSPITWTRGVTGWFDAARGTALGLMLAGTGLTAILAPPLVTRIVADQGWAAGYAALAAGVVLIAWPLAALLFRDPPAPPPVRQGATAGVGAALRSRPFLLMLGVFFLVTFAVSGLIPSIVPMLVDRGLAPNRAALFASLLGAAVVLGRIGAGVLLDRVWAPAVAALFLWLPAGACALLLWGGASLPLVGLAVVLVGLAAGAEFDLVAYMVSRYFPLAQYGVVYSQLMVGMLVGGGFGPPVFGRVFDLTGSYAPALFAAAAIFALAPLPLLRLGRYPAPRAQAGAA